MGNICNCGTCQQAVERAVGIIKKQILDDECPVFIMTVAQAMFIVAQLHIDREYGPLEGHILKTILRGVAPSLIEEIEDGNHMDSVSEAVEKATVRSRQERDLPKGH